MESMIYIALFIMLGFIVAKNFSLLKRYKENKQYIESYRLVLKNEENAYERIREYIASQKNEEYINKARVLKLYVELKDDIDYVDTLNSLDLKKVFYNKKGEFDRNLVSFNSDSFVFIMMCMSKAYAKTRLNVAIELCDKVKAISELSENIEYQEVIAFNDALFNKNDNGYGIMNCLLNGEYTKYKYDKHMIGIYKRIASATLAFKGQSISEYDEQDLVTFSKSLIGKQFLSDLRIYDKYTQSEQERSEE